MMGWKLQPRWLDSHKKVSGKPGAVQIAPGVCSAKLKCKRHAAGKEQGMGDDNAMRATAWTTTVPRIGAFLALAAFLATRIVSETDAVVGPWFPNAVALGYVGAQLLIAAGLFVVGRQLGSQLLQLSSLGIAVFYTASRVVAVVGWNSSRGGASAESILAILAAVGFAIMGVALLRAKRINRRKTTASGIIAILSGIGILASPVITYFTFPAMFVAFAILFSPKESSANRPMKPLS
jgi:hypothetical protein